jgi:hypothetical protein
MICREARRGDGKAGLRAVGGGTVGQPSVHLEERRAPLPETVARHQRPLHRDRHEHVEREPHHRAPEALGRDADDRERTRVEDDRPADHRGIASKELLPGRVTEHDDRLLVRMAAVGLHEAPPERRPDPEQIEEVRRDHLSPDPARLSVAAQVHRDAAEGDEIVDAVGPHRPQVDEVRVRETQVVARARRPVERHQPGDVHAGDRPQDDCFDPAEDRRVGADPETEHQHRDEREERPAGQHAPGEPQIVGQHAETPV